MEISPLQLSDWRKTNKPHLLIDIREAYEYEIGNINGKHIPMGEIIQRLGEIPSDIDVVVHCKSGNRAEAVCHLLQSKFTYKRVYNLRGGYMAYRAEVEPELPDY
jgi:rhodanese-related sulfurtransferase